MSMPCTACPVCFCLPCPLIYAAGLMFDVCWKVNVSESTIRYTGLQVFPAMLLQGASVVRVHSTLITDNAVSAQHPSCRLDQRIALHL